jgi:hypothetical protein
MKPNDFDKAYLAGIIDGEGYITLRLNGQGAFTCRVNVANNSVALHAWIQERWGQSITNQPNKGSRCIKTEWNGKEKITNVLLDVMPYLIIKRKQAEIVLEYYSGANGSGKPHAFPKDRLFELVNEMENEHSLTGRISEVSRGSN